MTLAGNHLVLGITGGVASYKVCTVARRLTEKGAAVDVVMTRAAARFVGPVIFEALTHRPVHTSLWERGTALDHIRLAQETDAVVIAPLTANFLARVAQGMADDILSAVALALTVPVIAAPAMNDRMYSNPATQRNLELMKARGWQFVGPRTGALAERDSSDPGRMAEPEEILAVVERLLRSRNSKLRGRKVVVTAGPTRESIDLVRVISNRSSGKMGYAIALEAFLRGSDVTLISGPTTLAPPRGVRFIHVENTAEMGDAVARELEGADVLVMAAAPADFAPRWPSDDKLPRVGKREIEVQATPDILEDTIPLRSGRVLSVGFALEGSRDIDRAKEKLRKKKLDMIVHNRADRAESGFESDANEVDIITESSVTAVPLAPKADVAAVILDGIEAAL